MGVLTKPPHALWLAATFRIAAAAIAVAAAPSSAHAQSAGLVLCDPLPARPARGGLGVGGAPSPAPANWADRALCARPAADPADPDKPADAKGVAEIAPSDIATAIKFCRTASNSSRRALYQLGRAYAANRRAP